jgi:type II secretory pathway pseudopilin PulG
MTLMELLVVIVIILLLLAVFAPLVRTSSRDRRVREASRALSGYINGTRLLASLRGRPVGIWIERFKTEQPNNGMYSTTVFTAEVPPPYAGWDVATKAKLVYRPGPPAEWEIVFGNNLDPTPNDPTTFKDMLIYNNSPTAMIKPGESFRVRFDYRGPIYRAYRDQTDPSICVLDMNYPNAPPVPRFAQARLGVSFQVYRAPIKSAQPPLELPVNSAIDLLASGFGAIGTEFNRGLNARLVILFEPSGDLGRVYYGNQEITADSSIHILIGRPEQAIINRGRDGGWGVAGFDDNENGTVDEVAERGCAGSDDVFVNDGLDLSNIMDMTSLWVTISHRTGQVTTTENANPWRPGPDGKWGVAGIDDNGNGIVDEVAEQGWVGSDDLPMVKYARQFARGKISGGGL